MRRLPIDTTALTLMVAEEPREVVDFSTKERRVSPETGAPLSSLKLLVQSPSEMSIISVKVAGLVGTFKVNDSVRVSGLTASAWIDGSKPAWSFSAESIELARPASSGKAA